MNLFRSYRRRTCRERTDILSDTCITYVITTPNIFYYVKICSSNYFLCIIIIMSTFVTNNLNSNQMRRCYIIELVYKVLSFRANVLMDDVIACRGAPIRAGCYSVTLVSLLSLAIGLYRFFAPNTSYCSHRQRSSRQMNHCSSVINRLWANHDHDTLHIHNNNNDDNDDTYIP